MSKYALSSDRFSGIALWTSPFPKGLAFISVPHMSEVENGKTKLRLSTFVYITEALQVSADVLLRPNIPEVNGIYQGEFNDLLTDCTPAEIDSIIKIVKELKTTMRIKKDDYLF